MAYAFIIWENEFEAMHIVDRKIGGQNIVFVVVFRKLRGENRQNYLAAINVIIVISTHYSQIMIGQGFVVISLHARLIAILQSI